MNIVTVIKMKTKKVFWYWISLKLLGHNKNQKMIEWKLIISTCTSLLEFSLPICPGRPESVFKMPPTYVYMAHKYYWFMLIFTFPTVNQIFYNRY